MQGVGRWYKVLGPSGPEGDLGMAKFEEQRTDLPKPRYVGPVAKPKVPLAHASDNCPQEGFRESPLAFLWTSRRRVQTRLSLLALLLSITVGLHTLWDPGFPLDGVCRP